MSVLHFWEESPYLKKILTKDPKNKQKVICKSCCDQKGGKFSIFWSSLAVHLSSNKHTKSLEKEELDLLNQSINFLKGGKKHEENEDQEEKTEEEKKEQLDTNINSQSNSEISFSLQESFRFDLMTFIVQENLPFEFVDTFMTFMKGLLNSYKTKSLLSFIMNRKILTSITNSTGKIYKEKYLKILESTPYSLAVDEGTTKMNETYLGINAKFMVSDAILEAKTKLLGLIKLGKSSAGESLYNLVKDFLFSGEGKEKRLGNLMGIVSDGATNMRSLQGAGLTNRFKSEVKHIVTMHDFCHVKNLVIRDAFLSYPSEIKVLLSK